MTPAEFLATVINPSLAWVEQALGPKPPASAEAKVMLLAIAGQEADWKYRAQIGGPARGYWEFEPSGVAGLFTLHSTMAMATHMALAAKVPPHAPDVYHALATNNNLAAGFARLLLWSDPRPLPEIEDEDGAWDYYLNLWRPGRPGPDRWSACYQAAVDAVKEAIP